MILSIGEILFDVFPRYRRIGGAPFNFAYHVKGLGLRTRFVSRVGKDEPGFEILSFLSKAGFAGRDIQIDPNHPTGAVNVALDDRGVPTFTILENRAYDHLAFDAAVEGVLAARPALVYFGSLIQRTDHGFSTLHEILDRRPPGAMCLYDMNLRPGCTRRRILQQSLRQADILKLNEEELHIASEMFGVPRNAPEAAAGLMDRFGISMIALTRGAEGSELYVGKDRFGTAAPKPPSIADTVGAGDAYAAMLAAGHLKKWPPEKILSAAARFSSRVCTVQGAVPDSLEFYDDFRSEMEEDSDA